MTKRLGLTLAIAIITPAAVLVAQAPDEPSAFELRRLLIDRIEDAYTDGNTAELRRMAGLEPLRDSATVIAEARALLNGKSIELPTKPEKSKARRDLLELIDNSNDDTVYGFYRAALDFVRLEKDVKAAAQRINEMIRRNDEWRQRQGREVVQ